MKTTIKISMVFIFALFACVFFSPIGKTQTKQVETAGQKFKNIKVLNDMPADQMGKVMNLFAASLGVNCNFCHMGEDFEKDGKKPKEDARDMIKMTLALNKVNFNGRPEISCNTCHGGHEHPQSAINLNPVAAEERPKQPDTKPTTDQILDKYVQAVGGKENVAKITSRSIKASRIEPDGKSTEVEEVWQKGNKFLLVTNYPNYVVSEAFDGANVWKRGNSDEIVLKPDEANQVKRNAQIFTLTDLKTVYSRIDYRAVEKINGHEAYLMTATNADNSRERLYFDVQTGLLVRRIASTPTIFGNFQYQVDYADFKDFGGVKLPTTTRFAMPGITWTQKILEVKNNVSIDDAKFNVK